MSYKILIVDDSKLARMAATKALNALRPGWTRIEAASAEEALSAMKTSAPPDVALLDFNMPGRDGLDLAAELCRSNPAMPVGVVSANHQQSVLDRTLAIGASFLPKPLNEQVLAGFIVEAEKRLAKAGR